MRHIAITPQEFQSLALAWISALTVVGGALATFVFFILGKVKQATNDNAQRLDDHSRRISSNNEAVKDIALQLPPPEQKPQTGEQKQ